MVPFTLLAQRGCTSHASLVLSLTAEFAPLRAERAEVALDELAVWLEGARDDAEPLLVDTATGRVVDVRSFTSPVAWQCSHQVVARILNRIGERAERLGHVAWALRAAELRLALPFEGKTRERLEADLRRIRARLN